MWLTAFAPISNSEEPVSGWLQSTNTLDVVSITVNIEEHVFYENVFYTPQRSVSADGVEVFSSSKDPYADTTRTVESKFVKDGERLDFTEQLALRPYGADSQEQSPVWDRRSMWTGEQWARYAVRRDQANPSAGRLNLLDDKAKFDSETHIILPGSEILLDTFPGDGKPVRDIFAENLESTSHLRNEVIGDVECSVIQCVSEHGIHTLWIDALHEHIIRKATIEKRPTDLVELGRKLEIKSVPSLSGEWYPAVSQRLTYSNVVVSKLGERFVCTGANVMIEIEYEGGRRETHHKSIELSDINFSPDFEALRAFSIASLPDGTDVYDLNLGLSSLELKGGEVRVKVDQKTIERIDSIVDVLSEGEKPPDSTSLARNVKSPDAVALRESWRSGLFVALGLALVAASVLIAVRVRVAKR